VAKNFAACPKFHGQHIVKYAKIKAIFPLHVINNFVYVMETHIFRNKFIQPELFYELFIHMNCRLNIFAAKPYKSFITCLTAVCLICWKTKYWID